MDNGHTHKILFIFMTPGRKLSFRVIKMKKWFGPHSQRHYELHYVHAKLKSKALNTLEINVSKIVTILKKILVLLLIEIVSEAWELFNNNFIF